jgi:UDP-glucose 4-epimerase
MMNKKTILVTGGAGFVGSHLCEHLLRLKARVICLDNLSTGKLTNIRSLKNNPKFIFHKVDINQYSRIAGIFKKYRIDYVFHYAAMTGVKNVIERPLDVFRDIDGLENILALSRAHKIKKLVFASSSEAYGEPINLPEREDGPTNIYRHDPYGLTKLVGESMVINYWKKYKLPACALRFFNVYGPKQESSDYGFVIGIFITRALQNKQPIIFGDGSQTRDFIYIDDNVKIALAALSRSKTNGEVINVGSGRQITILDLAERISELCNKKLKPIFRPVREMEIRYRAPDITKMKKLIGLQPKTTLKEGLKKTIKWYSSSYK